MNEPSKAQQVAEARNTRIASLTLEPVGPQRRGAAGFIEAVTDIWHRREMLGLLVSREITARYKDSALGFLWGLVRPLTQLLVYYLVLGHFLGAARSIPEFAVFIFSGLTIYGFASEVLMLMTGSIVGNSGLVKKVYLPREVFPLAALGSAAFNFMLQMLVLLAAALLAGTFNLGWNLVYALAGITIVLLYSMAAGLALAAVNVYLRDVQYLVEVIVMLMMWTSPIVYSWTFVGTAFADLGWPAWLNEVFINNPLTLAVISFQAAFWAPGLPPAAPGADPTFMFPELFKLRLLIAGVVGLILVFLSQRLFSRLQGNFAQEL
ncbi:ABC transporter permease [Gulosibacter bifidus]|uniref:Transport permease protein n=1 Tax=Gulosibacter bifidus TaxID=272239 RepID=A0ABW5RHJ2_9MICO|nr:ABC transporter permease [Gulosibacter bifidus]